MNFIEEVLGITPDALENKILGYCNSFMTIDKRLHEEYKKPALSEVSEDDPIVSLLRAKKDLIYRIRFDLRLARMAQHKVKAGVNLELGEKKSSLRSILNSMLEGLKRYQEIIVKQIAAYLGRNGLSNLLNQERDLMKNINEQVNSFSKVVGLSPKSVSDQILTGINTTLPIAHILIKVSAAVYIGGLVMTQGMDALPSAKTVLDLLRSMGR